mgnify:CR=1 FL=1
MITVDELAAIPLFSALTQNELEYLAGAVEDIRLIPGEYVAHEGEGRFLAVVVEGKTELTKLVNGAEQVIVWLWLRLAPSMRSWGPPAVSSRNRSPLDSLLTNTDPLKVNMCSMAATAPSPANPRRAGR